MPRTVMAVIVAIVLAPLLAANEKPTEGYQQAMRNNGEALAAVRAAAKELEDSGAGTQDYVPFLDASATMKASLTMTLAFWQAKKADDAVKMTQDALKVVADLEAGAKDRNYRVVLASFTALGETCGACHAAHRVRLPDGAFEIK